MEENTDWLINRENSIGNSKEIYVRGKKVSKVMKEKSRKISLEQRYNEALRKAKEVRENIKDYKGEASLSECLAYDMQYVEDYVENLIKRNKELEEENKGYEKGHFLTPAQCERIGKNYIPKSLVEETINENKFIIETDKFDYEVIEVEDLQELLKGE